MDFARQVELAHFPAGVMVTVRQTPEGRIFQAVQAGRGLELLVTTDAVRMYGEGPTVALALERLKKVSEAGLPEVGEDGTYQRAVFVGD
ncbi:hypothetical protein ACFP9V_11295 [Deinococcus radiopugnans]|uniref:Uncharacterized protein n=1 Tax=Deinococcus radiopugnans ATCC 19172 TaxID=585398 RepID=A0A5C4YB16_9DEIO|nr:hypothetical protein [Deinococcus radiopugnans]MBB6016007.1 hypothetical protein [Deinococcus radiopugnans ATCC 19172]TNM72311.1 hypothetical protein FHR04_03130 [Deinococcus radiopugnans ATCC 19172]